MCVLVPSSVNCSTHNCFGVADWLYPGDGFLNTLHTMTNEKVMWTAVSSEISHCTLHMHIVLNTSLRV